MIRPFKTRAELALEHLESLGRPLTNDESDQLRRSLHAVYCRARRQTIEREAGAPALAEHKRDNAETLARVEREALS